MTSRIPARASRTEVTQLWLDRSIPVAEICAKTGLTPFLLSARIKDYGLPIRQRGPLPTIRDAMLFSAMWKAGVLAKSMAHHFEVSERTIGNTRRNLGLPDRSHSKRTQITVAQFMARDAAIEQRQMILAEMADVNATGRRVGAEMARVG